MDHQRAEDRPPEGSREHAAGGRLGRRLGAAVFWVMALYLVVVAFYSVVPQVFGEAREAGAPAPGDCRSGLASLRDELVDGLAEHVRAAGSGGTERTWLRRWDAAFEALSPRCRGRGLEEATTLLARIRVGVERQARRFDRDLSPSLRRLEALLSAASPPSSPAPRNEASP